MSVSVMFIYWILCCLFCTYMIPRVLFTRNLDWPKGVITDSNRRYRGYIFEETPSSVLLSWFVRERGIVMLDSHKILLRCCKSKDTEWYGYLETEGRECYTFNLLLGVSFKLVCCTSSISSFSNNVSLKVISKLYQFKFLAFHNTFFWCNFIFSNMAS